MNKKLIFRILGALSSALIIVSVFVPFISVKGYSSSLWQSNVLTNSLYLPIMIIIFGAIGVLFFALNKKIEFAYMSSGAILFFVVVQTFDIINQGGFNTLGVGYYFLVIGSVFTGVMAFLCNLKPKQKNEPVSQAPVVENPTSMLDQIDKLYNDQNSQSTVEPIQLVNNGVEPLPVQSIEQVASVQPEIQEMPIPEAPMVNPNLGELQQIAPIPAEQPVNNAAVNPALEQFNQPVENPVPVEPQQINPIPIEQSINNVAVNPVLEQFNQQVENPVLAEPQQANPIPAEQPVNNVAVNPVLEQFNQSKEHPTLQGFLGQPVQQDATDNLTSQVETQINGQANIPLSNINDLSSNSSVVSQPSNTGNVDIFGQPINK